MDNKTFDDLPAASALSGSEIVPAMQSGTTKRTTLSAIAAFVSSGLSIAWSAITGKPTTLSGYGITDAATSAQGAKADTAVQPGDLADVATSGDYADLSGRPTLGTAAAQDSTAFAAAVHTHAASDIVSGTFVNARVAQSNVTQHQASLSIAWSQLTGPPSFFSGDVGDLTGFPGGTTNFLRADGTFAAPPGAGSVSWGGITGDLADQTDLSDALDAKADTATTLAGYGITDAATSAQGALADTAVQPGDLATVATSGDYEDLTNLPTLGSAAAASTSDFAAAVHTHAASDVVSGTFANARISQGSVTQHQAALSISWSQITSAPTTLSGYGITDAETSAHAASTYAPLASPALTGNPTAPTQSAGNNSTRIATTAYVDTADALKANIASPTFTGTPAAPTASPGTNTTQLATTAYADAIAALKANLASPTFTGTPAAPTASGGTNTTQIATTAYVQGELAAKAPLASPTFTGNPTAPTPTAGDNDTSVATTAFVTAAVAAKIECIGIACSDETTALTTGTAKVTFRMPYAFTLTGVRASLTTAQASGNIFTVDINEGGTTVLSTKLTIKNTEKTSTTADTPPVISDASLASDAEITIDIDQIGNGSAAGLKVVLIGHQ